MVKLTPADLEWIERKRAEVKHLKMLFKDRPTHTWDVPRAITIIDKLLKKRKR